MAETRDKAELLERLAERPDLSDEEREVLREAAGRFRAVVAAPSSAPVRSRPSRSERRARKSNPGGVPEPSAAPADLDAILWSDGAARGNPGPAGAGAVLKNGAGEVLAECSAYLGHTTNNVAEYKAVLLGLERALELGIRRIEVRADSELLIKQLRGEYRVRHEALKPLYEAAQRLLANFEKKKLVHVRREQNGDADRLANLGIDSR